MQIECYEKKGRELTHELANKIIIDNAQRLRELQAEKHSSYIEDLKKTFIVENAQVDKFTNMYLFLLRTADMPQNMHINFYATEQKNRLTTADSLVVKYKQIVYRINQISFINNYLQQDPETHLYIEFKNHKPIDSEIINEVNTNPALWAKHDKYQKEQEEHAEKYPESKQHLFDAIRYSVQQNCGCNVRYDENKIKDAISFKIVTPQAEHEGNGTSSWLLLPDGRILLYFMQGDKAMYFDYSTWGNKFTGVQRPCKVFDDQGKVLN
ncbi:hypothetical protein GR160_07370 [Flavobacterium sp. Sd200]|uniref:hypothetical protein n=1 Tax=Flavobacterium sp. Sd200 TaxID=2692211 RepID=UPI0013700ECF|nr:hypothetical protein [Flavobacterium sp. Sd200]MXN91046.1 hypothetical protein [Flavobacterium sp. Sd200]